MSDFFRVDAGRCVHCGACVRDCAFRALKSAPDNGPIMADPAKCMHCQHCFAICPTGAISLDGKQAADSVVSVGLELPSAEAVSNWMHVRRSTRAFRDEDVDRGVLERILRDLGNSPTGCNARSLTFTCYPNRESMNRFRRDFISAIEAHREGTKLLPRWLAVPALQMRKGTGDIFFRGASGMLIISSDETNPEVVTPTEDIIAACTYFEMLAQAHGIATCWCGFLKMVQQQIPELLEKTAGIRRTTPYYAMLFGKSAIRYPRGIQREDYARIDWR